MNIKRAFLAAAAVLMVPGFALAQTAPTTFDTNIMINQDIVEINVLRLVRIHEPGLDLQQAAHRAFQRLLDTDPLLRVDHLHGTRV